jgi:hypothetical protein
MLAFSLQGKGLKRKEKRLGRKFLELIQQRRITDLDNSQCKPFNTES